MPYVHIMYRYVLIYIDMYCRDFGIHMLPQLAFLTEFGLFDTKFQSGYLPYTILTVEAIPSWLKIMKESVLS